jgi:hypothetical protein
MRNSGRRQNQLPDARPWHEAQQRPPAPGAREHQVGDAAVHAGEEHPQHGARVGVRPARRQSCNGSVGGSESYRRASLPRLIGWVRSASVQYPRASNRSDRPAGRRYSLATRRNRGARDGHQSDARAYASCGAGLSMVRTEIPAPAPLCFDLLVCSSARF